MKTLWNSWKNFYNGLRIQTKLTLSHLIIVLIPMLVISVFFYTRLYDMIVSNTIRSEQEISAQTAPLIENVIDEVKDSHSTLRSSAFYKSITDKKRMLSFKSLSSSTDAQDFSQKIQELSSLDALTSVRIYIDCPQDELPYDDGRKCSVMQPLTNVWNLSGLSCHGYSAVSFFLSWEL